MEQADIVITRNYFQFRKIDYDKINLALIEQNWVRTSVDVHDVYKNVCSNVKIVLNIECT